MKYKVFVDDIRLAPTEYNKVFRDAESFLKWIKENPGIELDKLSLDHDLGDGKTDGTKLVSELLNLDVKYKNVQFHTSNGEGWKNMYSKFKSAQKVKAIAEYVKDKVDEYISGFYKSLLEIDNETKWTGQFPSRRLRY